MGTKKMNKVKAALIYRMKRNLKLKDHIKIVLMIAQFPVVFVAFIFSLFYQDRKKIWLIGETGNDAKDNGLAFFSYLRNRHPEVKAIYYIKGRTDAAKQVNDMGPTVITNSFRHKVIFLASRYILSTHDGYSIPFWGSNWHEFRSVFGWLVPEQKFVFLSHGVSKDDIVDNANYKRTRFDYYVTATNAECHEMSSEKYEYPEGNIIETGFARYDFLQNGESGKESIVFMPTWRYYLADKNDAEFVKSDYFKKIYAFLHSPRLTHLLQKSNIKFYFFPPHHEIQKRIPLFDLAGTEITPINTESSNFSEVVLKSAMMITDYSSVIFDFAYLYKRTAYFQFDLSAYRSGQYKEGYFKYNRDGFGPICTSEDELISEIEKAIAANFEIEEKYAKRIDRTFTRRDNKNSERLFSVLTK